MIEMKLLAENDQFKIKNAELQKENAELQERNYKLKTDAISVIYEEKLLSTLKMKRSWI